MISMDDDGNTVYGNPDSSVSAKSAPWHVLWSRDLEALESLRQSFEVLKRQYLIDGNMDAPEWTAEDVRRAILSLGVDKCPGGDGWTGRELRMLPHSALAALACILNRVEALLTWPAQVLQVLVVLIPKPKGGDRPISLVSLVFKVWETLNAGTITTWESERIGFWDDATRGSSALRAAALRRMRAEASSIMGDEFAFILWDAEKFYDNVCLGQLFKAAVKCGLPSRQLLLGLQMLLAPRAIRVSNVIGEPKQPSNGLTAGSRRANFYARLLLYPILESMHIMFPSAGPRSYVDDMAQLLTGEDKDITDMASRSAKILIAKLRAIKTVISGKSAIVASRLDIAIPTLLEHDK